MGDHSEVGEKATNSPTQPVSASCALRSLLRAETESLVYRAEGHTSLVVANLSEKIVYRLCKRIRKDQDSSKCCYDVMHAKLQRGIEYVKYVMTPLIGSHLVTAGELTELQSGFADHINTQVAEQRPGYRKFQEVDSNCAFAVQLPDHCLIRAPGSGPGEALPTYSIEIKSKCGFLPAQCHICENSSVKLSVCRFCLHQYIKVKTGKWEQRSLYCPVNLFSGNYKRMAHALQSLFKTPQNNLRMFKDGAAIFGDDVQDIDMADHIAHFPAPPEEDGTFAGNHRDLRGFIDVVIRCLLYTPPGVTDTYHYPEQFCIRGNPQPEEPGCGLPRACALGRVLYAQRLDSLDIERIYPLYERVRHHLDLHPEDRKNWNLDGPFSASCWNLEEQCQDTEDDGSVEFAVQKVREFLVSRTAKDCSVMVAIQPLPPGVDSTMANTSDNAAYDVISMANGAKYRFSVAAIDLDPKPWDKIARYFKEDSDIVNYHKQYDRMEYLRKIDCEKGSDTSKVGHSGLDNSSMVTSKVTAAVNGTQ